MTVGEKWFAIVATAIAAVVAAVFAYSVVQGHTSWQKMQDSCLERGGTIVSVYSDNICATVDYKVTPR